MIWQGWLFIGAVALVMTLLGFRFMARGQEYDDLVIVVALVGLLAWAFFAFQALDVEILVDGTTYTRRYAPMAVFGAMMAVAHGFMLLYGPLELADQRTRATEDVRS